MVFDMFILDMMVTLSCGMTLYLADERECINGRALDGLCRKNRVEIIHTTPSKLKLLMDSSDGCVFMKGIRKVLVGGEALNRQTFEYIRSHTDAEIFNVYGPAETTVYSSLTRVEEADDITVGSPIANTQIYILDQIDTQVKIRGLRIELGEIESVMSEIPGIGLSAAAAARDGEGREYLTGYYTAEGEIDESDMRSHLRSHLPRYMIPAYFVRLSSMPMTPSGKIDRKNLPAPDFKVKSLRPYAAPKTEKEKALCSMMAEVLSLEKVGLGDDFFELGGDSLAAISLTALANEAGIQVALQDIFDHPTAEELLKAAADTAVKKEAAKGGGDYARYNALLQGAGEIASVPERRSFGNVLLTGATGFLGAHVLEALLKTDVGKICCLVRSRPGEGAKRLAGTLDWYFGGRYRDLIGTKILPVEGDIEEDLGGKLPSDISTVIHTAATVKHFGTYDYFRKINVVTTSVSGASMGDNGGTLFPEKRRDFDERSFYLGQSLDNVYIRSKFEAERILMDLKMDRGLDLLILRVGNLTGRTGDLVFQPNYASNAFLNRMRAFLEIGMIPDYLKDVSIEFSPVDQTAEAVVVLTGREWKDQTVFHACSDRLLTFSGMSSFLSEMGISLRIVSGDEFLEAVSRAGKTDGKRYIFDTFRGDMDERGMLLYDSDIRVRRDRTAHLLRDLGLVWEDPAGPYLKEYIEYFRQLGYLHA